MQIPQQKYYKAYTTCIPATASTSHHHLCSAARANMQVVACWTAAYVPCSFAGLE